MELLIWTFLAYNILTGIILIIYFLTAGRKINSLKELLWLLFLPFIGLGKWHYNNSKLDQEEFEYPEKWYIYKHMVKLNLFYILFVCVIGGLSVILIILTFRGGQNFIVEFNDSYNFILELMAEFGTNLIIGQYFGVAILGLIVLYFSLIVLPKYFLIKIEKGLLENKLSLLQIDKERSDNAS